MPLQVSDDKMKTINDLFQVSPENITDRQLRKAEKSPDLAKFAEDAKEHADPKTLRRYITQEVRRLPELLDIDLSKMIAGAWTRHQQLRKYRDQTRQNPKETIYVSLVDHTIRSSHEPHIDFLVNGVKSGELKFNVKLALAIKGLELKIQNGLIKAMRLGSCVGSGEILLQGISLAKAKSRKLELGDEISLGEGIAIA